MYRYRTRLTGRRFLFFELLMKIDVILSPLHYSDDKENEGRAVVVVDVLRATTAICAAFKSGASTVVPLSSLADLDAMKERGYTIAAERDGRKVENAVCGNSPSEYLMMDLRNKKLAYSTTNGTVTILRAKGCKRLYIGAFVNLRAVADRIVQETASESVAILCSGWKNEPCLEDTLFAGALVSELGRKAAEVTLCNDGALMAEHLWNTAKDDLYGFCKSATHVVRLKRLGYDNDVKLALRCNEMDVAPVYDKEIGAIVL